MKRYALFAGNQYYPAGGWSDYRGAFDTMDEAREKARAYNTDQSDAYPADSASGEWEWWQIVDLNQGEVVEPEIEIERASLTSRYP